MEYNLCSSFFRRDVAVLACMVVLAACDDDEPTIEEPVSPDPSTCLPTNGPFTLAITNTYFPLPVGRNLVLSGEDAEGVVVRVEVNVLDQTEVVFGVTTRVVEVKEFEDGELVEIARDFYAQAPDGTVCYFGEDVDEYDRGKVVGHGGAWRAGEGGNVPGIIMPSQPRPGTQFAQESAPGIAEDRSAVVAVGVRVSVPAGTFENAAFFLDWNPLEGQTILDGEDKVYAPGIGLVVDDVATLVSTK
ncbi:MAG: hypothetical protein HY698_07600 [Deltaproteobacteria bacterium]|nr:hypothetical protein [Deltaproteobacteria bacterium]